MPRPACSYTPEEIAYASGEIFPFPNDLVAVRLVDTYYLAQPQAAAPGHRIISYDFIGEPTRYSSLAAAQAAARSSRPPAKAKTS